MQTRNHDWLDQKSMKPMYGIQVKHNGRWMNACNNDGPCLYETEVERDAARKQLAAVKPNNDAQRLSSAAGGIIASPLERRVMRN